MKRGNEVIHTNDRHEIPLVIPIAENYAIETGNVDIGAMMAKDESVEDQLRQMIDKVKIRKAISRFEADLDRINDEIYGIEKEGIYNLSQKRSEYYKNLLADRESTKERIRILENRL